MSKYIHIDNIDSVCFLFCNDKKVENNCCPCCACCQEAGHITDKSTSSSKYNPMSKLEDMKTALEEFRNLGQPTCFIAGSDIDITSDGDIQVNVNCFYDECKKSIVTADEISEMTNIFNSCFGKFNKSAKRFSW